MFCYGQSNRLQQGLESWLCGSSGLDFSESYMNQQDKRHRSCLVESRSIIIVTLGNWHFLLITKFIKKRKFSTQVIYWKSKNHEKLQLPMKVSKEEMNEWIEQSLTHIKVCSKNSFRSVKKHLASNALWLHSLHANQNTQGHCTSNRTKASPKKAPLPAS